MEGLLRLRAAAAGGHEATKMKLLSLLPGFQAMTFPARFPAGPLSSGGLNKGQEAGAIGWCKSSPGKA